MFLGGNLCRKKIFIICSFLVFCFSVLFSVFSSFPVSAVAVQVNSFTVSAMPPNGDSYSLINNIGYNSFIQFSNGAPPYAVKLYRFDLSGVNVTGNMANIHFETNFVFSQPSETAWIADFVNKDYISVLRCSVDQTELTISSSRISYAVTSWSGHAPSTSVYTGKNKTLTIYGDAVLTGLSTGSHNLSCTVGSDIYAFYQSFGGAVLPNFYIEQQPTSITFTTNESEALSKQQIQAIDNVSSSINNLSETISNQESDYDKEKADLEDKEDELSDESDDLSLSAQTPSDPFSELFPSTNTSSCRDLTTIGRWFGNANLRVCSPYTATFTNIANFVTAAFVFMLVVRVYTKHLKGGVDG